MWCHVEIKNKPVEDGRAGAEELWGDKDMAKKVIVEGVLPHEKSVLGPSLVPMSPQTTGEMKGECDSVTLLSVHCSGCEIIPKVQFLQDSLWKFVLQSGK